MTEDVCEGCGVPLQSEQPEAPGYVPSHVAQRDAPVLCRRCFRISHYGQEVEGAQVDGERAESTVMDVVQQANACVMLVDILDFEGSFIRSIARAAAGKLIVAVNKIDLLPSKTPSDEVADWVRRRLEAGGVKSEGVFCISAESGYGVRVLLDAARRLAGTGGTTGLVGATNVGKSTLVSKWLKGEKDGPTVSRFPGTTVGVVRRSIEGLQLEVLDTPGLLARGRLTDILCHDCAAKLVPDTSVSSKLLRLAPDQGVAFDGMAVVMPVQEEGEEVVALAFAAGGVPIQRIKQDKLSLWLQGRSLAEDGMLCEGCRKRLGTDGWEVVETQVDEMEDVVVHGLGWLSPRRRGIRVRVAVPAGAMVSTRPRLIGPKDPAHQPAMGAGRT